MVGHVEQWGDAVIDEGGPQPVVLRVGERATGDCGRSDHPEVHPRLGDRRELRLEPGRVGEGEMRDRVQTTESLARHGGAPAVPGAHVGGQGRRVTRQAPLPEQAEIGKEHGPLEAHRRQLLEAGGRVPVLGRELVVVGVLRWKSLAGALVVAPQGGGVVRSLHVGQAQSLPSPGEPGVADLVVDDRQRLLSSRRVDVIGPERSGLVEVLVRIDDVRHRIHSRSRPRERHLSVAAPLLFA